MTIQEQISQIHNMLQSLQLSVADMGIQLAEMQHKQTGDEYNIVAEEVDGIYHLNRLSKTTGDMFIALLADVDNGFFVYDTSFDGDDGTNGRFIFDNFTANAIRLQFERATSDVEEVIADQDVGGLDDDGNVIQPDYSQVSYSQVDVNTGYVLPNKRIVVAWTNGEYSTSIEDIPINDATRPYLRLRE